MYGMNGILVNKGKLKYGVPKYFACWLGRVLDWLTGGIGVLDAEDVVKNLLNFFYRERKKKKAI